MAENIYFGGKALNREEQTPLLRRLSYALGHSPAGEFSRLDFDKSTLTEIIHNPCDPFKLGDLAVSGCEEAMSTEQNKKAVLRYSQIYGQREIENQDGAHREFVSLTNMPIYIERFGLYVPESDDEIFSDGNMVVELVRIQDMEKVIFKRNGQKKGIFSPGLQDYYRKTIRRPTPWLRYIFKEFKKRLD